MTDAPFSIRLGYISTDVDISVREGAPQEFREALIALASSYGLGSEGLRHVVCKGLLKRPNRSNSSPSYIDEEVDSLIESAPWHKIYDVAECVYKDLAQRNDYETPQEQFAVRLNGVMIEFGIGWQMVDGAIVVRGAQTFQDTSERAVAALRNTGRPIAENEVKQALSDLSRRPEPDVTGAIQHTVAALECVARDISNEPNKNLGQLKGKLSVPELMEAVMQNLWKFASEQGRHVREGQNLNFKDAELAVTITSALVVYLTNEHVD